MSYVLYILDTNECDSSPCANSGVCSTSSINMYACDCSDTGYTGDTCETSKNRPHGRYMWNK